MDSIVHTDSLLISASIENFLFHCQFEKNLNPKTLKAYQTDFRQFCDFLQGKNVSAGVENISKETVKSYLQSISNAKPKTVKRKIASLKAMFNYLEFDSDDFINPFRKVKIRIKEPKILPTVMSIKEVQLILATLYNERNKFTNTDIYSYKALIRNIAVVELLFATGIRVSELCDLQNNCIDIKSGVIKVFGKGSKERIIQICNPEVKLALKKYYQLYSTDIRLNGYFFINRLGNKLSTQSVRLMLHHYIHLSGLTKKITPHTFRHTFATLLLEENVDIRYIQNMLGHSTITTTQIYTHINTDKQKHILSTKHPRRKLKFT